MDLSMGGMGTTAPGCLLGRLLSASLAACRRTSQVGQLAAEKLAPSKEISFFWNYFL